MFNADFFFNGGFRGAYTPMVRRLPTCACRSFSCSPFLSLSARCGGHRVRCCTPPRGRVLRHLTAFLPFRFYPTMLWTLSFYFLYRGVDSVMDTLAGPHDPRLTPLPCRRLAALFVRIRTRQRLDRTCAPPVGIRLDQSIGFLSLFFAPSAER